MRLTPRSNRSNPQAAILHLDDGADIDVQGYFEDTHVAEFRGVAMIATRGLPVLRMDYTDPATSYQVPSPLGPR
ncbi:MAG: hypothetical protein OXI60_08365 [Acidiferrobacterales bacterium]|nr:hypothetical protein [Acidiferrobacterales bacterium]